MKQPPKEKQSQCHFDIEIITEVEQWTRLYKVWKAEHVMMEASSHICGSGVHFIHDHKFI